VLPPNIKQMLPEKRMRRQLMLHFTALALLLGAVLWPPLASVAGLSFARPACGWSGIWWGPCGCISPSSEV